MTIKNVPNILSIFRLLLVPVIVCLFLTHRIVPAVCVFVFAGLTDVADGYIARRYQCTSVLGRVLDPLADKTVQLSALICLWHESLIPWWMPAVYLLKEILTVLGAVFIFRKNKHVVSSNVFGKAATVIVFAAVTVIALFGRRIGEIGVGLICLGAALYFVFSCGVYCGEEFIKTVRDSRAKKASERKDGHTV